MDWEWFKAAAGRGARMWPCQGRGRRSPAEGLNPRASTGGLQSADLKKNKEEEESRVREVEWMVGYGLVMVMVNC